MVYAVKASMLFVKLKKGRSKQLPLCTSADYIVIFEDPLRCRAVRVCRQFCESHRQEGQKNRGPNKAI